MAYVLGFFVADGYITVNRRGGQFWCIQITDKELLENIKIVLNSEHKISMRLPKKRTRNITHRIQIGSKEMCEDLRRLGIVENKTKNLKLPEMPKKYLPHFVRGYFDGDGNIWMGEIHRERKTRHQALLLAFTSCSHEFLSNLRKHLESFGVEGGSLFRSKKKEFSRLQYSTKNALKLGDLMYNGDIGDLFLQRKKRVFNEFESLRL